MFCTLSLKSKYSERSKRFKSMIEDLFEEALEKAYENVRNKLEHDLALNQHHQVAQLTQKQIAHESVHKFQLREEQGHPVLEEIDEKNQTEKQKEIDLIAEKVAELLRQKTDEHSENENGEYHEKVRYPEFVIIENDMNSFRGQYIDNKNKEDLDQIVSQKTLPSPLNHFTIGHSKKPFENSFAQILEDIAKIQNEKEKELSFEGFNEINDSLVDGIENFKVQ